MDERTLIKRAREAQTHAHAGYSHFAVGAALVTQSGHIYTGCNIENSSYGATVCAERVAMFSAIAAGEHDFAAIAVVGSGEGYCYPCGICRQVMTDFAPQMRVICVDEHDRWEEHTAAELLPCYFTL